MGDYQNLIFITNKISYQILKRYKHLIKHKRDKKNIKIKTNYDLILIKKDLLSNLDKIVKNLILNIEIDPNLLFNILKENIESDFFLKELKILNVDINVDTYYDLITILTLKSKQLTKIILGNHTIEKILGYSQKEDFKIWIKNRSSQIFSSYLLLNIMSYILFKVFID
jgi:hypothetical protein